MIKDAFNSLIKVGDTVLYSPASRETVYNIGEIVKIHPAKQVKHKYITNASVPDRVEVSVFKSSSKYGPTKNVIVYASNVVKL